VNLTYPDQLKSRLLEAWLKGRYFSEPGTASLRSAAMYFRLKGPTAAESLHDFDAVRRWTEEWAAHAEKEVGTGAVLEWKEWDHRQLGKNRIPVALSFANLDTLARYLKRHKELDAWRTARTLILTRFPSLEPWVLKQPLALLENAKSLGLLLDLTDWYLANQKSGMYLRQVPVRGVDTKFIEKNRAILRQWWSLLVPEIALPPATSFEERFGFLSKPEPIRFRLLDIDSSISPYTDLTVPAEEFARNPLPFSRILIVENDITALSLPSIPDAAVIFGRGYGFTGLAKSAWLHEKKIWYWGDLDTNGFCILDQLRASFPSARSILMDRETFLDNRDKWVTEKQPSIRELTRLNEPENSLYRDLHENRFDFGEDGCPRLEQELIPWKSVLSVLEKLSGER